jgi:hypothetical protein
MPTNPIIEQLVCHLQNGEQVRRVHPELSVESNKSVTFYFEDGTSSVFQTESDHNKFMRWWRDLAAFIQMTRKIQDVDKI